MKARILWILVAVLLLVNLYGCLPMLKSTATIGQSRINPSNDSRESTVGWASVQKDSLAVDSSIDSTSSQSVDEGHSNNDYPTPYACEDRLVFLSEQEFIEAIMENSCEKPALDGIVEYYVPKLLEEGFDVSFIFVKKAYIALQYNTQECEDFYRDGNYYLFEWCRNMQGSDLQNRMSHYKEGTIEKYEQYYIWKGEGLKSVYWEEYGLMFHAIVPDYVPNDQLSDFCTAIRIPVD